MAAEKDVMQQIMLSASVHFPKIVKIFRNNTGQGWAGKAKAYAGKVVISNPNPLHAGLCKGSSDLIGWAEKIITPEMVGQKVAIFVAAEVKGDYGKLSKEQLHFLEVVAKAGGIAGLVRSEEDFIRIIKSTLDK